MKKKDSIARLISEDMELEERTEIYKYLTKSIINDLYEGNHPTIYGQIVKEMLDSLPVSFINLDKDYLVNILAEEVDVAKKFVDIKTMKENILNLKSTFNVGIDIEIINENSLIVTTKSSFFKELKTRRLHSLVLDKINLDGYEVFVSEEGISFRINKKQ